MIILGLTGGIGSGKTYIANLFQQNGVPVYNSDSRAKELMSNDVLLKKELVDTFGIEVFVNGNLNRKLISEKIFNDKSLLLTVNSLVHPRVNSDFKEWVGQQDSVFVIKEAAILIESGLNKDCDKILVVTAPLSVKVERVMARDNMKEEQIISRMNNQMLDEEREKYADFIIDNDGKTNILVQVDKIYASMQQINNKLIK